MYRESIYYTGHFVCMGLCLLINIGDKHGQTSRAVMNDLLCRNSLGKLLLYVILEYMFVMVYSSDLSVTSLLLS